MEKAKLGRFPTTFHVILCKVEFVQAPLLISQRCLHYSFSDGKDNITNSSKRLEEDDEEEDEKLLKRKIRLRVKVYYGMTPLICCPSLPEKSLIKIHTQSKQKEKKNDSDYSREIGSFVCSFFG